MRSALGSGKTYSAYRDGPCMPVREGFDIPECEEYGLQYVRVDTEDKLYELWEVFNKEVKRLENQEWM